MQLKSETKLLVHWVPCHNYMFKNWPEKLMDKSTYKFKFDITTQSELELKIFHQRRRGAILEMSA